MLAMVVGRYGPPNGSGNSHGQRTQTILAKELDEIFRLYAAGKIKPVVSKTFSLEEAAEAHRNIHSRQNVGKVVLCVA